MRRRVELAVLLFGAAFLAFLIYSFRPGRRPSASGPTEPLPTAAEAGQPTTVLKGFDYTETVRGKPIFHIQSERTVGFGPAAGLLPNLYALEKVTLTVYPETGAPVTVHADNAKYDQRTSEAHLSGNVRWVDGRGALGETAEVAFQPSAKVLTAPGAVRLSRGSFALEAKSGTYDVARREAKLDGPIRGSGGGETTGGLTSLAADGAVYRRDDDLVELSGSVSAASKNGDRIASDAMVLKLREEGSRFDWARAEGHVRGSIAPASLPGRASGARSRGARDYSGERAGLLFAEDGSVRSLSLTGSPAAVDEASRKVRASTIEVSFEGGRASSARATGSVRIESESDRGEADSGAMSFDAAGEIQTLELAGSVKMEGDGRTGRADRAVDILGRGVWVLTGRPATVEGDGSKVSAAKIEIDQKDGHKGIRADGGARAVLVPKQNGNRLSSPVGDASRPTYGKAARMTFDDASRVATFSGGATLWQETSSVFGDDMTVNDAERTLVAVGNTRTVFAPPAEKPAAAPAAGGSRAPAERHPSIVTARRLVYRETPPEKSAAGAAGATGAARTPPATLPVRPSGPSEPAPATARFEGAVTVTSGEWRASADQATGWIGADRRLDRVELSGGVSFEDSKEGRSGKAERATDWPREGKTVLEGKPAFVVDREGNRVAGATLTIAKRGGSVEVTAPEGGRTETIHKTRSGPR